MLQVSYVASFMCCKHHLWASYVPSNMCYMEMLYPSHEIYYMEIFYPCRNVEAIYFFRCTQIILFKHYMLPATYDACNTWYLHHMLPTTYEAGIMCCKHHMLQSSYAASTQALHVSHRELENWLKLNSTEIIRLKHCCLALRNMPTRHIC